MTGNERAVRGVAASASGRSAELLSYRLLGPVEVLRDGVPIELGVLKQRALLAMLLIHANQVVSTDQLIDELWAGDAGKDRQNALWVNISRLRSTLEPDRAKRSDGTVLATRPPGYVLNVVPEHIDAVRFEALTREGRSLLDTDPASASLVFSEALSLWRGRALEEFTFEPFAEAEVARLDELRLATVEDRINADLRTGRARELIGELESLVRQHPLRERLTAHLMLALHRAGRQGDALRAFGSLRTRLGEDLGLDPSEELCRLEERIVLDDPALREVEAARALDGRPQSGLSVRGYELREKIGEGALGNVFRAFQPAVGREVAIKVIRPELANDPGFIRRFEREAQAIAGLEHPQIVPVFDYWREPDSAYLVMRRFEHGSLFDAVERGTITEASAIGMIEQVGGALAAAHRKGVTHGDVKPRNVLLDGDGNAYLADFGMSYSPESRGAGSGDAPTGHFAAPEQRAGRPATTASDVYALGMLARYTLREASGRGGERPGEAANDPVTDVISLALSENPADRFPDADAFVRALQFALGDRPAGPPPAPLEAANPYRGLRAFGEDDAGRFYGRERLVERLITRLGSTGAQGRFVVLVGPSGSGKSSVVRAGVVPALREGAVTGSDRWFIVSMSPGRRPFEALEDALRSIAVSPPVDLLEQLLNHGISNAVRLLIPDPSAQLVVVVDQLEELFSHAAPADANAFMTALADTAGDRYAGVKVIATLRADFYDHPLRHTEFGELVRLGTEVITPMNAEELERAITAPAAEVGVPFESGLVAVIASDMAGQPTALPLMQYALTELFERRSGSVITTSAYRELGGVSAALARRADALYQGLDATDREHAREVFLRLVTLNDGSADTRRRALATEVTESGGGDVSGVLDVFGRARLLTFDRDPVTRGPTVEIAHEALLTEWTRLRDWIDDARADIRSQRRLAAAAAEWRERDRDPEFVLTGARLGRYDGWLDHPPVRLTAQERQYLAASRDASEARLAAEQLRVRRLRRLVAGIGVALVIALIAGGVAFSQRQRARTQTEAAELATLISRSAAVGDDDSELSLLLALEAHRRAPGPDTDRAVLSALGGATIGNRVASRQRLVDDCTGSSVFGSEYRGMVELATVDGRTVSRDPLTGDVVDLGRPPGPCTLAFHNDERGEVVGAIAWDGSRTWLGSDFGIELDYAGNGYPSLATDERILMGVFEQPESVDDLATTKAILFDIRTGEQVGAPIEGPALISGARTRDGSVMALGFGTSGQTSDGFIVIVDADTGEELVRIDRGAAGRLVFEDATGRLIAGFVDGRIETIDPNTGNAITTLAASSATSYLDLAVRPDGLLVAVSRGGVQVIDRNTGPIGQGFELRNAVEAFVRPDGLITAVDDQGLVAVYDIEASALLEGSWDVDPIGKAAIRDGRAAVVNETTQEVELIDLSPGERSTVDLRTPDGEPFTALGVFPEPDGVWAVSPDHDLARWEGDRMVDRVFMGSDPSVRSNYWYEDGTRFGEYLAILGRRPDYTGEASLLRMRRGAPELLFTVATEDNPKALVHPTLDGGLFVLDSEGTLHEYDPTGAELSTVSTPSTESTTIALDPTGSKLAFSSLQGGVFVFDTHTREIETVPGGGVASTLGFDGDGSVLVISMWDGTVLLYGVGSGDTPSVVWDGPGTLSSEAGWYDPTTDSMWIPASGKLLHIPLSPERWVEKACALVSRDLTQDEWDRDVPGDQPLRSACG
ncbi:MAG: protein kinase [Acidimicrobiia bacterium]|nr:protein kinase [Acidimicrobiia bacterium]MDH4307944.1 protein kinase [Acidimicrobiia bacterium]